MPTIAQASVPATEFPNDFISPYGNDGVIPLYSSIPITTNQVDGCLPCVFCGNTIARAAFLQNEANTQYTAPVNRINIAVGT